jgi:hypothetical protein
MTRSLRIACLSVAALLAGAMTVQAQQKKPEAPIKPQPPLAPMASQHVLVLPVQMMRADTGAWIDASKWEKFRRELDDSIGSMISDRGVGKTWKYASDAARIAKRNPDYVSDPYSMGVQAMRAVSFKIGDPLPDLFNNNLRSLVGIADTRYVLVPVEVYFAKRGPQQIAVLKLALVDGRGGTLVWLGEVGTEPATEYSPAMISTLATRVANLVVAP